MPCFRCKCSCLHVTANYVIIVRGACVGHITGVSIAVGHVNEGNLTEALDILDHIIATTTGAHMSGAHVARGTARAMLRDLQGWHMSLPEH